MQNQPDLAGESLLDLAGENQVVFGRGEWTRGESTRSCKGESTRSGMGESTRSGWLKIDQIWLVENHPDLE